MKPQPLSAIVNQAISGADNPLISGITLDSRAVNPGDLFVAVNGEQADGHDYIENAIKAGAIAIAAEREVVVPDGIVRWVSPSLRSQLGAIAARCYPHSQDLPVVGITGTNGKTSVCDYVAQLLGLLARKTGQIGTLGVNLGDGWATTANTTPDVISTHRYLHEMYEARCHYAAMEVSSHALVQKRVDQVAFQVAVFTNLSHDHLDYHQTLEAYKEAKAQLFSLPSVQVAIVNDDDEAGHLMAQACHQGARLVRYSQTNTEVDAYLTDVCHTPSGYQGTFTYGGESKAFSLGLSGDFNLSNMMAAVLSVTHLGFEFSEVVALCGQLKAVPGRMENVVNTMAVKAVVDYAHTPDALEKALIALREETPGKLIVVFGCGGDRDPSKRPLMGRVAEAWSDFAWITSDNPRSEDPGTICDDVSSGFEFDDFSIEVDRKLAITKAVNELKAGDTLLLAGKGHENYQIIGSSTLTFDDAKELRQALAARERAAC